MDWGATAAWIALALAIISPLVTAMINNRHALKMKELEITKQRMLSALEDYTQAFGYYIADENYDHDKMLNLLSAQCKLMPYISQDARKKLNDLFSKLDIREKRGNKWRLNMAASLGEIAEGVEQINR